MLEAAATSSICPRMLRVCFQQGDHFVREFAQIRVRSLRPLKILAFLYDEVRIEEVHLLRGVELNDVGIQRRLNIAAGQVGV
ncbi:hypothetical protein ET33_15425 [Paenibacillus tyrfis]|uniref:Uncharacterized protein n=1 Tax=Paenibacillus tyrfis TaxID=1501230 RepID=A0A081NYJ9_9BACL|nr:hypothetical protein ET33_15425 [Paenibacillus tyrfis]